MSNELYVSCWLIFENITVMVYINTVHIVYKLFKVMRRPLHIFTYSTDRWQIKGRTVVSGKPLNLTWFMSTCPLWGKIHYKAVKCFSDRLPLSDDETFWSGHCAHQQSAVSRRKLVWKWYKSYTMNFTFIRSLPGGILMRHFRVTFHTELRIIKTAIFFWNIEDFFW